MRGRTNPVSVLSAPRPDVPATPRFYYKGNRLKQLRAFCYTVKFGTLTRAAEALFLSQPSVSLQLAALEAELGAALIERRRRRVTLTHEGQVLYELARPLVEGLESLDEQFAVQARGSGRTTLDIACGNSTIQYLLPDMVTAFAVDMPSSTSTSQRHRQRWLALLRSDEVDFAVGRCSTCRTTCPTRPCTISIRC